MLYGKLFLLNTYVPQKIVKIGGELAMDLKLLGTFLIALVPYMVNLLWCKHQIEVQSITARLALYSWLYVIQTIVSHSLILETMVHIAMEVILYLARPWKQVNWIYLILLV